MSELARRLHQVDPTLKIVSPHHGHRMSQKEWEKAAGDICKNCGKEYQRGREGLCYACWEKAHEFEIRDPQGCLNFLPESLIMPIVHKSGET